MSKAPYSKITNSTAVTEFLLTRFSEVCEYRVLHTMLFLLIYLATLIGNFLIVVVTTCEKKLHTPMFFFLRNLSVLDMCYISVTIPKACVMFLLDSRVISMAGCVAQIFLVLWFAYIQLLLLTIMARDCYVAICQPLHYPVIVNPLFCVQVTLATLLSGVAYAGFHTGNTFRLSFCHSNVVHQFFCDVPSLLKLSCSDTFRNEIIHCIFAVVIDGGCFVFITMSYISILFTVLKFPTREQGKAFSTCVPHMLVVTFFLSSGLAVYLKPTTSSPTIEDMITSVFYSIVPPFLNPIIYSLRNKQIKETVRKMLSKKLYQGHVRIII